MPIFEIVLSRPLRDRLDGALLRLRARVSSIRPSSTSSAIVSSIRYGLTAAAP